MGASWEGGWLVGIRRCEDGEVGSWRAFVLHEVELGT